MTFIPFFLSILFLFIQFLWSSFSFILISFSIFIFLLHCFIIENLCLRHYYISWQCWLTRMIHVVVTYYNVNNIKFIVENTLLAVSFLEHLHYIRRIRIYKTKRTHGSRSLVSFLNSFFFLLRLLVFLFWHF